MLDRALPLAGAVVSSHPVELELAAPRSAEEGVSSPHQDRFFDGHGRSLVAGRAALVHGAGDPQLAAEYAARAGAAAVVVYGTQLPAGGLGLDESVNVPVLSVPLRVAGIALTALKAGEHPAISIGVPRVVRNGNDGSIAPFSSRGLAFDGRVKPDLAAPGVAIVTSEPGANDDGSPRFGTVNGSSPAAAVVAGAAAVLAQTRPALRGVDLRSLLTGTARSIRDTSVTAQGSGLVDLGASAAGELTADPVTLAFGRAQGDGWHSTQQLVVRNVSTRRLLVRVRSVGSGGLLITSKPKWVRLKPGGHSTITLQARLRGASPGDGSAEGMVVLVARGAGPLKIPWAITFGPPLAKPHLRGRALSELLQALRHHSGRALVRGRPGRARADGRAGASGRPARHRALERWQAARAAGPPARPPARSGRVRPHRPRPRREPARARSLSHPAGRGAHERECANCPNDPIPH